MQLAYSTLQLWLELASMARGEGGSACTHPFFLIVPLFAVFPGIAIVHVTFCSLMAQTVHVCKDARVHVCVVGATGVGITALTLEKAASTKTCVSGAHQSYNQLVSYLAPRTPQICSDVVLCNAHM